MRHLIPRKFYPNRVLIYLTLTDMFTWGFGPIISTLAGIYLADKLGTDVTKFVGVGVGIYFLARAAVQVPLGSLEDTVDKDRDEITFTIVGAALIGIPLLFFPLINQPIHYYIAQFLRGLGTGIYLVSWRKLFAANLDKHKEATEYGESETFLSLTIAIVSMIAGLIANLGEVYFNLIFIFAGLGITISGVWSGLIFTVKKRKSSRK